MNPMTKAEQPTITQIDIDAARSICGLPADPDKIKFDPVVQAFARHRTTSLAAQDDVTLVEELRAEISNLEAALNQIAGSHWERWGADQTDIENVPDLSAEEAMNVARDALSNTPAPSLAAQDGLVEAAQNVLKWLQDPQMGTWTYVEGNYFYRDIDAHAKSLTAALSAIKGDKS